MSYDMVCSVSQPVRLRLPFHVHAVYFCLGYDSHLSKFIELQFNPSNGGIDTSTGI